MVRRFKRELLEEFREKLSGDGVYVTEGGYEVYRELIRQPIEWKGGILEAGVMLYTWENYGLEGIQVYIGSSGVVIRWTRSQNGAIYGYPQLRAESVGFATLKKALADIKAGELRPA